MDRAIDKDTRRLRWARADEDGGKEWEENKVLIHFGFNQIKAGVIVLGLEEMGIFLDKLPQRFSRH